MIVMDLDDLINYPFDFLMEYWKWVVLGAVGILVLVVIIRMVL